MTQKIEVPAGAYDGYIFDCDGTLADSMPLHFQAWTETIEKLTGETTRFDEALFYSLGGMPAREIVEWLNLNRGYALSVHDVVEVKEGRFSELLGGVGEVEPVANFLRSLGPGVKKAVASGGLHAVVERTLKNLRLFDLIDAVVCSDDVPRGKPFPDLFLRAAELISVPPARCLVLEDGVPGFKAAEAAGMAWLDVRSYYAASDHHVAAL